MSGITEQQKAVVDAHAGTIVVKACPGSGKTWTLVERCKRLPTTETKLVLAFNKKAAQEFSHRLGAVAGADVRTFHSFCFREVMNNPRVYDYRGRPSLAEESLFRQLCRSNDKEWHGWDESDWDEDFIKECEHSGYSSNLQKIAKSGEMEHDNLIFDECEPDCDKPHHMKLSRVVASAIALLKYRRWLIESGLITFDAMVRVVAEYSHELKLGGQHIMVDEYQDVDQFQFDIACALARTNGVKSFVCVGDPNQRIYEWRGALSDAFGSMVSVFPQAQILPMTKNFRSLDSILKVAEKICPVGMTGVKGDKPGAVVTLEPNDENLTALLGKPKATVDDDLSKFAVLCRYNRDCARWQLRLSKSGVPVYLVGAGDFWTARHIRMAKDAWQRKMSLEELFSNKDWVKYLGTKKFRNDPDKITEVTDDARWIMSLSAEDMKLLEKTVQREDIGLRIATIHKTKGMEFDRVMVSGITEKLRSEKFVYYVAVTRAKEKLVLA